MTRNKSPRRKFIKLASTGLGGIAISSLVSGEKKSTERQPGKKLRIVCVGAHPGDPEFGCGGTMARYAEAGHKLTFIYLTRGEAFDSKKTYAEAAALRTKEAETSCKILQAKPVFAGQIDGSTILSKEKVEEMKKLILAETLDKMLKIIKEHA